MNALTNLIQVLETGANTVQVPEGTRARAQACITRMLDFTAAQKARAYGMTPGMGAA